MDKILNEMVEQYDVIYDNRTKVATLKKEKSDVRPNAWADATGTAKEKEDYVRSAVSSIDEKILLHEANIERAYNQIHYLEYKLGTLEFFENE